MCIPYTVLYVMADWIKIKWPIAAIDGNSIKKEMK
jgi:hypothetical protein